MADKAILCGINSYKSISSLNGCINDLQDIQRLLIDNYSFAETNIRIYTNEQVVKETLENGFDWLATDTGPGDRVLFHFSGHGSFTTSKSPDKDVDELLCLYNMDWKDEGSFVRDTDLGALTRRVNSGARLTVILDSCHSGTGTRAFTPNMRGLAKSVSPKSPLVIVADSARRIGQQRNISDTEKLARGIDEGSATTLAQLRSDETPPVFARFVAPPANIQSAISAKASLRVRSIGQTTRANVNHQLLAAAGEKQTAADAFIDGQYRGAFSFHLCATVRQEPSKSFGDIMKVATQRIKQQGFSQDPQIEGPFTNEPFLGAITASSNTNATTPQPPISIEGPGDCDQPAPTSNTALSENKGTEESFITIDPLATLNRLLEVSDKLIDLARERSVQRTAQPVLSARAVTSEVIIYVHGISEHLPGYSAIWHKALAGNLARPIRTAEVRWSQLVNARAVDPASSPTRALETEATKAQIQAELERRTQRLESMANRRNANNAEAATRGVIALERSRSFAVDDFTRYMLSETTREAILKEFFKVVVPELEAGSQVHIISHSWGTVVAYEGLRRLDGRQFAGKVNNLFTAGSALSIGTVQTNLFGRVNDGRMPTCVNRIINLDAGGDVVGGPIGDEFTVDKEYLGLDPIGCRKIPFTGLAFNPACAHRSYFLPENLAVNRDIFAASING